MINQKRIIVYIPARSGSKSIIDKNIIDVAGKPLIAWSIEAAKNSKYVDRVIVSTDSAKYAEIARQWGAEAPFLRPEELSGDLAREMDSCQHLMSWVETNCPEKYDIIIKLEPTSPLRTVNDVDTAIEKFVEMDADTVITVTEAFTHPFWMNLLPSDNFMGNFISPEIARKNRQELPKYYQLDGVVFVGKWDYIKTHKTWFAKNCYATITPQDRAVDIDGPVELELVRYILSKREAK